jgi:hypothetical protein
MAGLWVLAVIATGAVCGFVAACILSVVLYIAARRKKLKLGLRGHRLTVVSACAPFVGLLWLVTALLLHVQISNRLAHQDCGLSGDPYVTLPNGYIVGSLNTYDGYLVAPGSKTDTPVVGPGYVRSIVDLHYSEPYFTGTLFDFDSSTVRSFVFDTRTKLARLSTPADQNTHEMNPYHPDPADMEAWTAANNNAQTGADSYWKIYYHYRHHWPNYVLLMMILAGEGAIVFWVRRTWVEASPQRPEI